MKGFWIVRLELEKVEIYMNGVCSTHMQSFLIILGTSLWKVSSGLDIRLKKKRVPEWKI